MRPGFTQRRRAHHAEHGAGPARGINRGTVLQIAGDLGIETCEREVDLTELYIADEVFACGTSTYIAPSTLRARPARTGDAGGVPRLHGGRLVSGRRGGGSA